jgi:hypothetical protein
VFDRERTIFREEFPEPPTESIDLLLPFAYLLCGGVSLSALRTRLDIATYTLAYNTLNQK